MFLCRLTELIKEKLDKLSLDLSHCEKVEGDIEKFHGELDKLKSQILSLYVFAPDTNAVQKSVSVSPSFDIFKVMPVFIYFFFKAI